MRAFLLGSVVLSAACGGAQLTGTVADVTSAGLHASITVIGTSCQATSDESGAFSLPCRAQPCKTAGGELDGGDGKCTVAVAATNYISKELRLDLTEPGCCSLGKLVMVRIPESDGLFKFSGDTYEAMHPGYVRRNLDGRPARRKSWCIDRAQSTPNALPAGKRPFFDKRHDGWRAWKLDGDGCVYRMSQEAGGKWQVDYAERPGQAEQQLEAGMNVVFLELDKGEYFIADWKNGFFVEARSSDDDKDERKRYSGFLVTVD